MTPGTSSTAGTLTINGNFTLSGGAVDYNTSPSLTTGNDLISVTSANSNLSGNVTVNVGTALGYTVGAYTLINDATGLSGSIAGWNAKWDRRGNAPTLSQTANTILLNVTAAAPGNNLNWLPGTASGVWDVNNTVNWYNTTVNVPPPGPGLTSSTGTITSPSATLTSAPRPPRPPWSRWTRSSVLLP